MSGGREDLPATRSWSRGVTRRALQAVHALLVPDKCGLDQVSATLQDPTLIVYSAPHRCPWTPPGPRAMERVKAEAARRSATRQHRPRTREGPRAAQWGSGDVSAFGSVYMYYTYPEYGRARTGVRSGYWYRGRRYQLESAAAAGPQGTACHAHRSKTPPPPTASELQCLDSEDAPA